MNEERDLLTEEAPKRYHPRPLRQLVLAWVLLAIVVFAFLGMCYWLMNT